MKVILAGSRDIVDKEAVFTIFDSCPYDITEVVCGCARGVDRLGEEWATMRGIPVKLFPAKWQAFSKAGKFYTDKSAGFKRNLAMGEYADALFAIWDGRSRGTKHMLDIMQKLDKPFGWKPLTAQG